MRCDRCDLTLEPDQEALYEGYHYGEVEILCTPCALLDACEADKRCKHPD